jgi:hypothetical protein
MTPIERYRHLMEHWRAIRDEAANDLAMAQTEMVKWHMLLAKAEETNG